MLAVDPRQVDQAAPDDEQAVDRIALANDHVAAAILPCR